MALHRILVVDDSPAIRETLAILLGGEYEIEALTLEEYLSGGTKERLVPDLIIAGAIDRTRSALQQLRTRILWLLDEAEESIESDIESGSTISRRFSPHELKRRVQALVSERPRVRPVEVLRQRLQAPYLTPEAARVVAEALNNDLPLLLCGERGIGKRSVARALHLVRGGVFVATTANTFSMQEFGGHGSRDGTLFIDRVNELSEEAQARLLASIEPNGMARIPSGPRMRLVTAAACSPAEILEHDRFSRELYYRLSVLTAQIPPLRERTQDIPAIARLLANDLARWLGLSPVSFTPQALERLSNYLWFGNLAELEAVLARTLSIRRRSIVDADDLLFESTRLLRSRPVAPTTRPAVKPLGAAVTQSLDLIINELAHEFKNPLVTIRAFAQHLRHVLHNGTDGEHVARLTGEAVEQMDHALENLLQFTRFAAPKRRRVSLPSILTPALTEVAQTVESRGGRLSYEALPPVAVLVDAEQVTYALTNLLHALSRNIESGKQIAVRYRHPATITIQLPSGSDPLGGHLVTLLDTPAGPEPPLPLRVAIASALLERNGGALTFEHGNKPTNITVRLAIADDEEEVVAGDGKAPSIDR